PSSIACRYSSGTSLSSLRTDRLITCQRTLIGRSFSTSRIHREVIHAHGHRGSNQKSTGVAASSATSPPCSGNRETGCLSPQRGHGHPDSRARESRIARGARTPAPPVGRHGGSSE